MIEGQNAAIEAFLQAWRSGAPHHAWLLTGPRGIGKASFAKAAAARVLAEAAGPPPQAKGLDLEADHPTAKLLEAGSHPDFRLIEREMNKSGTNLARNIKVEQVRSISRLLGIAPSLGDWRVVIVDAADDLEASGANALLKMLEEPPAKTLFFLVAHAPGRLLPTIRSRCRKLAFQPLGHDAMASVLDKLLPKRDPKLIGLAQGSVGRALAIAELDLAPVAEQARAIMREGDPTNARRSHLAKSLSTKANAERYAYFLELVPGIVADEARAAGGERRERALAAYGEVRETVAIAPRLSLDPGATAFRIGSLLADIAEPA